MCRSLAAALFLLLPVLGQSVPFATIVPPTAATTEGSGITSLPFGAASVHVMYAYDGSVVAHQAAMRITAIELRPDQMPASAQQGNYTFTLAVSTSRNPAQALDLVFADNHGADRTVVYSGGFTSPPPVLGQSPNPFGLRIPFFPPFEWDPRCGPLLLDFDLQSTSIATAYWDCTTTGVGAIFGGVGTTVATSVRTYAPVLRIEAQGRAVPANRATIEGSASVPLWSAPLGYRRQDLYEASLLGVTQRQLITGLSWRTDVGSAMATGTFGVTVALSTGVGSAAAMSATFASNHGPDRTVVYTGVFTATPSTANADPSRFDAFLPLQRPFEYDPTRGPLVVEVQRTVLTPMAPAVSFDAVSATAGARSLYHFLTSSATGSLGDVVPVLGLRTIPFVTAPSSLANTVNATGGGTNYPFGVAPCRALNVISAAASGVFQPTFIRHLRFRPAPGLTTLGPATPWCSVYLSHAATTPATLSSTFDSNHGSDRLLVFQGEFSVPYTVRGANDTDFPIEITLQEPFRWDPNVSPYLAIEVATASVVGTAFQLETTAGLPIDDGRVTATLGGAATGLVSDLAFVVQVVGVDRGGLATPYGTGCAGSNGSPLCVPLGLPVLPNHEFRLGVRHAPPGAPAFLAIGFIYTSMQLPGAPGCLVRHGVEVGTVGLVIADGAGFGTLPLALGNQSAFEGLVFRAQWLVLDTAANSLGVTVSDGLQLTARFF